MVNKKDICYCPFYFFFGLIYGLVSFVGVGFVYGLCFIVFSACFRIALISFSAFWCPVAVLGCAAMISCTLAARSVPIHP